MKTFRSVVSTLLFASLQLFAHSLFAQVQGQWTGTGAMTTAREFNAQVRTSGGKVLSIGGYNNSGTILNSAELYSSATGKWALTGSMAEARMEFPAVAFTNGKVLVAGGVSTGSAVLGGAELYDPTTGVWSPAGVLSVPRYGHTATLLTSGKVLVTGGCVDSACATMTAVSELYDPTLNTWTTTGSLNTARAAQTAVLLKTGKVLVVGGSPGLTSCELYNATTGIWSSAASTTTGRYLHSMTLLSDGKVLVAGGASGRYPLSAAEIYDATANTWTATGTMIHARYAHGAALLTDGTVVMAAGVGQSQSCGKDCTSYIPFALAETFNETTGKFTSTTSLSGALAYHSMTMLSSGRALESGGVAATYVPQSTASFYIPLSLTFSSSSLNFGLLEIGLSSSSQTVTVTNVGLKSETFTSIVSSGDYSESNTCGTSLAVGGSCAITITFTPTKSGTRAGTVTLKDNSPGSPTQTIALTGTGETLALGFTPASLNLGSVVVGSSSSMSATVTNDGSASVNITGISLSPSNSTYTQTNNCPAALGVQQSCTFTIVFTPPDVFTYKATLSVTNSAGSAATLALQGTGLNN